MANSTGEASRFVDPDPFVAASTFFAGASIVLNLVMIWQAYGAQRSSSAGDAGRTERLNAIESELTHLRIQLRRLTRAVERGSEDSDRQFYEVPFRLHVGRLEMDLQDFEEYSKAVSEAYMRCGNLSNWIHHIIGRDPQLASDLGRVLSQTAGDVADELNRVMQMGLPNRTVVLQANRILDALDTAIRGKLDDRSN